MAVHPDDFDPMAAPPGGWPEPPPDPAEEAYDRWLEGLLDWAESAVADEDEPDRDVVDLVAQVAAGEWPAPEQHQGFHIADDADAERAMRRYADADAELGQLQAQADQWAAEANDRLARIRQWFDHRAKRFLATKAFLDYHLTRYALDRRAADPKHGKTLVLPSGQVRTTSVAPKAEVADEDSVLMGLASISTELLDEVAPVPPRKLYVQRLRDHTSVVEVVDAAVLVLTTAEVVHWVRGDWKPPADAALGDSWVAGTSCPGIMDGWPTPENAEALVARVEVLASHLEVVGPNGKPVPGCYVEPGGITTKVVPA